MKKLFASILTVMLIFSISLTVYAADANWTSTDSVSLTKSKNQFNIEVAVDSKDSYAGGEFGIQCGDGVTVKSVTYSENGSQVGPTSARGLTWFSFFSGNNNFNGPVKATVTLEYTGTQNTSVVVDNISVYTKDGAKVETEKFTPRKVIKINREGASNPVEPPNPPDNGGDNGGENPDSPNGGDNGSNNNGSGNNTGAGSNNGGSTSESSGGGKESITVNGSNESTGDENNGSSVNEESDSSNNSNDNNSSTKGNGSKDSEDNNDIQDKNKSSISPVIIILLIISIGANGVLGYLIIKNKNKK